VQLRQQRERRYVRNTALGRITAQQWAGVAGDARAIRRLVREMVSRIEEEADASSDADGNEER
jgi:hypothetical protein